MRPQFKFAWIYPCVLAVTLFALFGFLAAKPYRVQTDVAYFLDAGYQILDGNRPYTDIHDINFPTIQYLYVIPVLLSQITHIHPILVIFLLTWLLVVWSACTCAVLLRWTAPESPNGFVYGIPFALVLYSVYVFLIGEFAQREHLLALCLVPALLVRYASWRDRLVAPIPAFAIGFIGALGLSIKPHYLLVLVGIELYWMLIYRDWRKWMRAEVAGFVAFYVLFAAYFVLQPDVLQAFIENLTLASRGYAVHHYVPPEVFFVDVFAQVSLSACVLIVLLQLRGRHPHWPLIGAFSLFAIIGFLILVYQAKGWYYQHIPYRTGVYCTLALLLSLLGERLDKKRSFPVLDIIAMTLITSSLYFIAANLAMIPPAYSPPFREVVNANTQKGDQLLMISNNMWIVAPSFQIDERRQASGYLLAYPVTMSHYGQSEAMIYDPTIAPPEPARKFIETTIEIIQQQPPLIMIDKLPEGGIDLYRYLQAHGVVETIILPQYRLIYEDDLVVIYRLTSTPS